MPISTTEAQQLADDLLRGRITEQPWFYLTFLALAFLASAAGAFVSAYLRKRGEALATKADFKELQEQLRQSTELAEEIKAEVHSRYGDQASLRSLLRDRTEHLVLATFELEQWLSQVQARSLRGDTTYFDDSPMSKVSTYRDIYFPEVGPEYESLQSRYLDYVGWLIELQRLSMDVQGDPARFAAEVQPHLNRFREAYQPFCAALVPFRARVIAAARARGGL